MFPKHQLEGAGVTGTAFSDAGCDLDKAGEARNPVVGHRGVFKSTTSPECRTNVKSQQM